MILYIVKTYGIFSFSLTYPWQRNNNTVGASSAFSQAQDTTDSNLASHMEAQYKTSQQAQPQLSSVLTEEELNAPTTSNSSSISEHPLNKEDEGCYLVYDSDGAKLCTYYSRTKVEGAIAFWKPGPGKTIQGFKFKKNCGRSDLIKNCAAGIAGRKNYYSGWCQYIRLAKALDGTMTIYERTGKGLDVDIYVYYDPPVNGKQTFQIEEGVPFEVKGFDAVTCLPKHADFFEDNVVINLNHWLTIASTIGASSKIEGV